MCKSLCKHAFYFILVITFSDLLSVGFFLPFARIQHSHMIFFFVLMRIFFWLSNVHFHSKYILPVLSLLPKTLV